MKTEQIKIAPANKSKLYNRFAELFIGITSAYISNFIFDYLLYPYIIYKLGTIKGSIVMTFLSFLSCILALKFYDLLKKDWLGIEAIKELKNYTGEKKLGKLASWFMTKSNFVIFLFLSIRYDSFITTVYMRNGKYSGMTVRDWTIFIGSLIIANAYWVFACLMGITIFEWAWKGMT